MVNDLEIDIHRAVLPSDLKGRITRPIVGIQDSSFVYVPAIRTNLAETFQKALAQIGERTTVKAA